MLVGPLNQVCGIDQAITLFRRIFHGYPPLEFRDCGFLADTGMIAANARKGPAAGIVEQISAVRSFCEPVIRLACSMSSRSSVSSCSMVGSMALNPIIVPADARARRRSDLPNFYEKNLKIAPPIRHVKCQQNIRPTLELMRRQIASLVKQIEQLTDTIHHNP